MQSSNLLNLIVKAAQQDKGLQRIQCKSALCGETKSKSMMSFARSQSDFELGAGKSVPTAIFAKFRGRGEFLILG
jgi:hypothetical protein